MPCALEHSERSHCLEVFGQLESRTSTRRENVLNQQKPADLAADLRAYVGGSRDSKRELGLLRRIRALRQAMRPQLLVPLLGLNVTVALALIDRAQLSRSGYLAVLQRGLDEADASFIYQWMVSTVFHLGWRKVFSVLRQARSVASSVSRAPSGRTGVLS